MRNWTILKSGVARAAGFTIIELMVSTAIIVILLAGVMTFLSDTTRATQDRVVRSQARDDAERILEMIAFELRTAGSGMPLGQPDFSITDLALGDAPLPILASSAGHSITFRAAPRGKTLVLTTDFTPSSVNRSFSLVANDELARGDVVYLSNITRGESGGMQATVASVVGNNVSIERSFTAPVDAVFEAGSIVHKVSTITYQSGGLDSGIVRIEGFDSSVFADHATVTFQYLDDQGEALTPPLTQSIIANTLAAVKITVDRQSRRRLRDGSTYLATTGQTVALRTMVVER